MYLTLFEIFSENKLNIILIHYSKTMKIIETKPNQKKNLNTIQLLNTITDAWK